MLETEQAFYDAHADEYRKYYAGQWIAIHGDALLGAYSTEQQAYEATLTKVGNIAVLIRLVTEDAETVQAVPTLLVGLTGGRS